MIIEKPTGCKRSFYLFYDLQWPVPFFSFVICNDFGQVFLFGISWNFTVTCRAEKILPLCSYKHSK